MGSAARSLVVSVHDVTPAHEAALRVLLQVLAEHGVSRTSLLVIPDYHRPAWDGAWELSRHASFGAWLRELEARGHEIVLHGLEHCDPTPRAGTRWQRLVRRTLTVEAEFYTLSYAQARERIAAGLGVLARQGLTPRGFVAPAWLHNHDVVRAVGDAGLRYVTSLQEITALAGGERIRARAICFSSRSRLRAQLSAAYCGVLARCVRSACVVRLAVHPADVSRRVVLRRLRAILRNLRASHACTTYGDLLTATG